MKKISISIIVAALCTIVFAVNAQAVVLLTKEQALKEIFPDVDKVVTENHVLTAAEIASIKEQLGGSLVHYQKGSSSAAVSEASSYDFYIGMKNNQKVRMAIIEEQPGKWGPVSFIIAVDISSGIINNLAVMAYLEKRGRPIARQNFLKQFIGKTSADPISVRGKKGVARDIRAISGATISSDCACFAVRKVIALYEEVYIKSMLAKL